MSYRFKVFFYARKNYVNKDGEVGIMVRISLNGQKTQFSSKLAVKPELWDSKASIVAGDSTTALLINEKLCNIKSELNFHYKELERQGTYVTIYKVRDAFLGVKPQVQMLMVVFKTHNEELKLRIGKDITAAGVEKYERTRSRLGDFIKYKYDMDDIPLREINYNFIYSFETYLTTVWKCSVNTTAKYLQQFKHIIALAMNNGWIQSDPFTNFKIRFKKVDRGYLNHDELTTIMQKKIQTHWFSPAMYKTMNSTNEPNNPPAKINRY